jgi:hypothetical protein
MKKPLVLIVLLVLAACGTSGASLTGQGAFTPNTQYAGFPLVLDDGGPDPRVVVIGIAEIDQGPQSCGGLLDAGANHLTFHSLGLTLANFADGGVPVTTGDYPISLDFAGATGPVAAVLLAVTDAGITQTGISGTVTLTQVGSTYAGSFTSTVSDNDGGTGTLSGSFSAPLCPP